MSCFTSPISSEDDFFWRAVDPGEHLLVGPCSEKRHLASMLITGLFLRDLLTVAAPKLKASPTFPSKAAAELYAFRDLPRKPCHNLGHDTVFPHG